MGSGIWGSILLLMTQGARGGDSGNRWRVAAGPAARSWRQAGMVPVGGAACHHGAKQARGVGRAVEGEQQRPVAAPVRTEQQPVVGQRKSPQ